VIVDPIPSITGKRRQ